jgi:hypothetical protein
MAEKCSVLLNPKVLQITTIVNTGMYAKEMVIIYSH